VIGVVSSAQRCADGTELQLDTVHGMQRVCVRAVADPQGADRVARTFRRCLSVRLTFGGQAWSSVVQAIGNRRPVELPVSTATALGLIERGLPTVVRLP
jgi:hypothetical protein